MTFAQKAIAFNSHLHYTGGPLPAGIRVMNPFKEAPEALRASSDFYLKYYGDEQPRTLILGINPGRHGAGRTGVPFTDTKRLLSECGITFKGRSSHEPSSVFVYEVIRAYGGPEAFYRDFYINSVCPLGFTKVAADRKETNYNYYDDAGLARAVRKFAVENIHKYLEMGARRDICFCFGTGKNEAFLRGLNDEYNLFGQVVGLEHPRFIMQYKSRSMSAYVDKYLKAFGFQPVDRH